MKRGIDLLVGVPVTLLLLVPMVLIALTIRAFMGTPIFYRDRRPGKLAEPFDVLKFRTMSETRATDGSPLPDADRLTRLGGFLRVWSLDELPQLFNVLRGDMSLVGPRPLLTEYLGRYTTDEARRHEVKPGITGWAQVNGRNELPWAERLALDVWYVDNWSLRLDLRILWMTLMRVVRRQGISAPGHATMPRFGEEDH